MLRRPALLLALVLPLGACRGPALSSEPWERHEAGTWGVGFQPALFTVYGIDGEFVTRDFASGGTLVGHDEGDVEGRFGAALRGEYQVTDHLGVQVGIDHRRYDVHGLTPTPELATSVDRIESMQYFGVARWLFPPFAEGGRWRPFGQVSLAWLPGVDVGFEVDLSAYGSSNLDIETRGEGYWVGGVAGGVLYQWSDRWFLELGLLYELPLSALDADLGFDIGPAHVPLEAEFEPSGLVGHCGLSLRF